MKVQLLRFWNSLILYPVRWVLYNFIKGLVVIWVLSPWHKALVLSAVVAYRNSPLWRNRCIAFGPDWADEQIAENKNELWFWKKQVQKDKKLMLKIVFTPFSIWDTGGVDA